MAWCAANPSGPESRGAEPRRTAGLWIPGSAMLIDEDGVALGIDDEDTSWTAAGLIGLCHDVHALFDQLSLEFADVDERLGVAAVLIPSRVGGESVAVEHPVEQADQMLAVLQDQPVLRLVAAEDGEPSFS